MSGQDCSEAEHKEFLLLCFCPGWEAKLMLLRELWVPLLECAAFSTTPHPENPRTGRDFKGTFFEGTLKPTSFQPLPWEGFPLDQVAQWELRVGQCSEAQPVKLAFPVCAAVGFVDSRVPPARMGILISRNAGHKRSRKSRC